MKKLHQNINRFLAKLFPTDKEYLFRCSVDDLDHPSIYECPFYAEWRAKEHNRNTLKHPD